MKRHRVPLLAAVSLAPSAFAKNPKIAADLESSKAGLVDEIVQFKPGMSSHPAIHAAGGQIKEDLGIINGMRISVPANALEA